MENQQKPVSLNKHKTKPQLWNTCKVKYTIPEQQQTLEISLTTEARIGITVHQHFITDRIITD